MGAAPPPGSFSEHCRSLLAGLATYAQARLQLAQLEAREAAGAWARAAALALLALALALIGYLLLCGTLVFALSRWTGWPWAGVLAAVALFHGVAAWGVLRLAQRQFRRPCFDGTAAEFKKDEAWLQSLRSQKKTP